MIFRSEKPLTEALAEAARALRPLISGAPPAAALVPATGSEELLAEVDLLGELPLEDLAPPGLAQPLLHVRCRGVGLLLAPSPPPPWEPGSAPALLFLARLLAALEVERVVHTAACAVLDPGIPPGTLAIASDHLDLSGTHLLRRPLAEEGPWALFPDLTRAHDPGLRAEAAEAASALGLVLPELVVAAVPGPGLPTPAEIRFYGIVGAEALVMSGPQELTATVQAGLPACLLLAVTQTLVPERPEPVDLEAMVRAAEAAAPVLTKVALALAGGLP